MEYFQSSSRLMKKTQSSPFPATVRSGAGCLAAGKRHFHGRLGQLPQATKGLLVSGGYSADLHPSPAQLREENDRVMRAARRFPNRAYGSVYLSPSYLDFSLEEFDRCVRDGPMISVGELEADKRCNAPELDP